MTGLICGRVNCPEERVRENALINSMAKFGNMVDCPVMSTTAMALAKELCGDHGDTIPHHCPSDCSN